METEVRLPGYKAEKFEAWKKFFRVALQLYLQENIALWKNWGSEYLNITADKYLMHLNLKLQYSKQITKQMCQQQVNLPSAQPETPV